MYERLEKIEERYNELEMLLSDPNVVKNQSKFQAVAKEMASLTDLVKDFRVYKDNEHEKENIQQLLKLNGCPRQE